MAETKEQCNARIQRRYDLLMEGGKHGHYETMFRVVREEIEHSHEADVVLGLELSEAQAILNALRESGVLDKPMIFHPVATLKQKVEQAIRAAGHNPL